MKEVCKFCGKKFDTQEALSQHASIKHVGSAKRHQKKKLRSFAIMGIVILIVIGF